MSRRFSCLLVLLLCGCEQPAPLQIRTPARLAARPALADPSCEALARATPGASWHDLGAVALGGDGRLTVSDPAVLGGPFEPPLRVAGAASVTVRALIEPSGREARTHCVQARLADGAPSTWKPAGEVGIDSDMLVLGDEAALRASLRTTQAMALPCAEAPAADLEQAVPLLRARGLELTPVLPTLACADREVLAPDRALVTGLLREIKSGGRFLIEPRMPALGALAALGARSWAALPADGGKGPAGLVIEVGSGDGLYPVRAGQDAGGKTLLIEIPLR